MIRKLLICLDYFFSPPRSVWCFELSSSFSNLLCNTMLNVVDERVDKSLSINHLYRPAYTRLETFIKSYSSTTKCQFILYFLPSLNIFFSLVERKVFLMKINWFLLFLYSRHGSNNVRIFQWHNDSILHYSYSLVRWSIWCNLLSYNANKTSLVKVSHRQCKMMKILI